jgi:osmotically-inducible protein OsmY
MRNRILTRGAGVAFAAALWLAAPGAANAAPDAWITTKVKMSLLTTEGVSATLVNVDTTDGRVTLHGGVRSEAEKSAAEQAAKKVQGVRELRNLLQVAQADEVPTVADEQIREQVRTVLERDAALADSDIEVASVNKGVVLLSGTARTLSDHQRALEDAASVEGVRRVASQIQSPDVLADEEIWREGAYDAEQADRNAARDLWTTSAAKLRLMLSDEAPALDVNVDTRNGVVTLFGMVPSEAAKEAAAAEVSKVDGVTSVRNLLQVVPESGQAAVKQSDDVIENAVETRLEGRSELQDAQIDVEVSNGVARLTGAVDTHGDRLTALTVARATSGVRAVSDALRLREQVGAR